FRQADFDIIYGEGISREGSILDMGVDAGVLQKTGTWYTFGDLRLGQGRENARDYLRAHPETAAEIERKVREALSVGMVKVAAAGEEEG
ncbi:MAG: DNA recombination/repair protein RecA, partial [Chloroflexi bacterium]|nr:DNA recombination/repair protein RecA [Chloroflexota bacterium]